MAGIEKINIRNGVSRTNIKNLLGYAVRKRKGYYNELSRIDYRNGETLEQFKSVGFINTGHTLKNETYSVTDLGDRYYKDVFGTYDYIKQRMSGLWDRFKSDLADRLKE